MPWIKAKNGNVFDVEDTSAVAALIAQGHEAFESDPRKEGAKAKPWKPEAESE